jgi:hypothetical protein
MAKDALLTGTNQYDIGYNSTGGYAKGELFSSLSLNASAPWNPQGSDLAFRTVMDYPIARADAGQLEVDASVGQNSVGKYTPGGAYFDVTGFEYQGDVWEFTVVNLNPFAVRFNWTAQTNYLLYADDPTIDLGDDGSVEWRGTNVSTVAPLDLADAANSILADPDWPDVHVDTYGNVFYRMALNVSVTSEGEVALRGMDVLYSITINTSDISAALNAEKESLTPGGNGTVKVVAHLSSPTAGVVNITDFSVGYDMPPYSLHIADQEIPEDGPMVGGPMYLDTLIFDDYDNNNLVYTVVMESGDANVSFNLSEFNAVTFTGPANWSGSASFHILAEDTTGLVHRTNTFNVTIVSVNDPPELTGIEDVRPPFDLPLVLELEVIDNDSPMENITIVSSSSSVTVDMENLTLTFLYPNGSTAETVTITASDGINSTEYMVQVTPIVSNTAPTVKPIPTFEISLDGQGILNLSTYVTDRESPVEELVWTVVGTYQAFIPSVLEGSLLRIIPVASVSGTHELNLEVADPDGNTVPVMLDVKLILANRHPPVILRGEDAIPTLIEIERGKEYVIELALGKYWYDQEDHHQPDQMSWEARSLRPQLFTVQIEEGPRLRIKATQNTGTGYFTLQLFDSDLDASRIETVQVQVTKSEEEGVKWLCWVGAVVALIIVVGAVMVIARRGGEVRKVRAARKEIERMPSIPTEEAAPVVAEEAPAEAAPPEPVPASVEDVLIIHENTSLVTQLSRGGGAAVPDEKLDELVELATLFAQERFEDVKVGTVKAFKFNGTEVLVGKGLNYFVVTRCTGNMFDDVVAEIKRSIINMDVQYSDRLAKWYPGQKLSDLEGELKELLGGGD